MFNNAVRESNLCQIQLELQLKLTWSECYHGNIIETAKSIECKQLINIWKGDKIKTQFQSEMLDRT